jgi:hypothetical protein
MSAENDAADQRTKANAFTIEEAKTNSKVRDVIKKADLFFGYNVERDMLFLYFGQETLEAIANNPVLSRRVPLKVAAVKYRESVGEELEYVLALSLALKGSYFDHNTGKIVRAHNSGNN